MVLRASVIGRTSAERVAAIGHLVAELSAGGTPLQVARRQIETAWVISVGDRDVFAIVPADVDTLRGETVEAKATAAVARLQQALDETSEAQRPRALLWALVQVMLVTIALGLVLAGLHRANDWAGGLVERTTAHKLSRSSVGGQLVHQTHILQHVRRVVTAAVVIVGLSVTYVWVVFSLRRFPYTRPWGESLRGFLLGQLTSFGGSLIDAVPGLFTIVLIVVVTRLATRLARHLFDAVEQGAAHGALDLSRRP